MSVVAKQEALAFVQRAKAEWADGNREGALELMNDAHSALVHGGYSQANLPGIFGYVDHLRKTLAELAADAA